MKAVILAGGLGTRLSEETALRPKPMVEIGGKPILWHIMKIYSHYGINDFIICCGYKGYFIKEYFANYVLHTSDVTIDLNSNSIDFHNGRAEPWKITLVDTGDHTMTGGRLKRVAEHLKQEDTFCFTYGDGVGDIDIAQLIKFHQTHGKIATLTATHSPGRFGALNIQNKAVESFEEKPKGDGNYINGGFFVLSSSVLSDIMSDETSWEYDILTKLSTEGKLMAYQHDGFWQPMDTLRDKNYLEELWESKSAPWKVWS